MKAGSALTYISVLTPLAEEGDLDDRTREEQRSKKADRVVHQMEEATAAAGDVRLPASVAGEEATRSEARERKGKRERSCSQKPGKRDLSLGRRREGERK